MPERTATRPIRLDSFVRNTARFIWANVEEYGKVGVTPEFLAWLNNMLKKYGKDTINLEKCVKCHDNYWTLGTPSKRYVCDECA